MQDRISQGRRARTLQCCRDALETCDEATLRRLECMLGTIALGARLEQYLLSAPADRPLPPEMERMIALFDPAMGEA